jgi:hypothetical protein
MNLDGPSPLPNYARARDRWPQAQALAQHSDAIYACVSGNRHGVVEYVKSFIECVCATILGEFGERLPSSNPGSTELLGAALRALGFQNSRGASKLDSVLSGFNRLSDALNEMRNENGPVAHGRDGFLDAMEEDHARAYLHTGDAIVGLLMNALEGKQPNLLVTREPYERFKHLCERIDRSVGVEASVDQEGAGPILVVSLTVGGREEAIQLRIEPSRLLYGLDRTAFLGVLTEVPETLSRTAEDELEARDIPTISLPGALPPSGRPEPSGGLSAGLARSHRLGMFKALRSGLRTFLISESISANPHDQLLSSLLASAELNSGIDWQTRDGLQSRMKIGFRRVLAKQGVDPTKIPDLSERLLTWLRLNVPASTNQTPAHSSQIALGKPSAKHDKKRKQKPHA